MKGKVKIAGLNIDLNSVVIGIFIAIVIAFLLGMFNDSLEKKFLDRVCVNGSQGQAPNFNKVTQSNIPADGKIEYGINCSGGTRGVLVVLKEVRVT